MTEEGPLQFFHSDDFWGYRWIGHCYYIESRNEDMLFGDRLSNDLEVTRQYCRAANIAHRTAVRTLREKMERVLTDALRPAC